MSVGIGRERQFEVYVGGARGSYPTVPVSFGRLERAAQHAMSPEGFAYVAGGAGTEETMRENRAAFERWRIVPRVLRDVSTRDTAVEVLGTSMPSPFVLCPIGVLEMAHREARCRRRARCSRGGNPVRLLQPGVAPDGGDRPGDGRSTALVPALLEHVERPRREPHLACRELLLLRHRAHPRHDHARLATRCQELSRRSLDGSRCSWTAGSGPGRTSSARSPLGPRAVGLGRPYAWGLAAGGENGVREVIRNLRADFDLTTGLAGVASVRDIGPGNVVRS